MGPSRCPVLSTCRGQSVTAHADRGLTRRGYAAGYGAFAAPLVRLHVFQSVAALFVSEPFGSRQSVMIWVSESATVAGSGVPSTSETGAGNPMMLAAVIEPS